MKKIVIINQDSGYLMIDIANAIANMNFDVSLITGRLVVRNKQLAESVKVKKIVMYHRNNKFRRLLSWIFAFFQVLFLVKTKYRKDYLFIVTNPPFTTFLPLLCRNRFSLMIFDVYPDTLTQMGLISENSLIVRYWGRANIKVFTRADNIFTLTDSMALRLLEYSNRKKLIITPIWSDDEFFKPLSKDLNPFLAEHDLRNRFIVLYSGNLGATHNVEIFAELAQRIRNPEVIFIIIGEGDRKKSLAEKVRKLNLHNCLLLPLQPVDRIPYSFSAADIAIVSLNEKASGLSLPSKTFSFMSAGLPLLCIAGEDSELKKLVKKYNNGRCFAPDKLDEIAAFIEEIAQKRDLLEVYKANSLNASQDFTAQNADVIADTLYKSIVNN